MTAVQTALALRAEGKIDDVGLQKVAVMQDLLYADTEKVAAPSGIGGRILESLARGAEHAVAPLVFGMGVAGAGAAGRALYEKTTKGPDLKRILEVYPSLAKEYKPEEIQLVYNSMRHMNPHIAKDPLAGGTLLKQLLNSRDSMRPKEFRFDADLAGALIKFNRPEEHRIEDAAQEGAQIGVRSALEDITKNRHLEMQHNFQRAQQEGQNAFADMQRQRKETFDTGKMNKERAWRQSDAARETGLRRGELAAEHGRKVQLELLKARLRDEGFAPGTHAEASKVREGERQDVREVLKTIMSSGHTSPDTFPMLDEKGRAAMRDVYDQHGNVTHQEPIMTAKPTLSAILGQYFPYLKP